MAHGGASTAMVRVPSRSSRGCAWVAIDALPSLPLWEGDRHFLPLVFDTAVGQFHGVMPYRDGKLVSWSCTTLPLGGRPGI